MDDPLSLPNAKKRRKKKKEKKKGFRKQTFFKMTAKISTFGVT